MNMVRLSLAPKRPFKPFINHPGLEAIENLIGDSVVPKSANHAVE
jgi:hypothetical protein